MYIGLYVVIMLNVAKLNKIPHSDLTEWKNMTKVLLSALSNITKSFLWFHYLATALQNNTYTILTFGTNIISYGNLKQTAQQIASMSKNNSICIDHRCLRGYANHKINSRPLNLKIHVQATAKERCVLPTKKRWNTIFLNLQPYETGKLKSMLNKQKNSSENIICVIPYIIGELLPVFAINIHSKIEIQA